MSVPSGVATSRPACMEDWFIPSTTTRRWEKTSVWKWSPGFVTSIRWHSGDRIIISISTNRKQQSQILLNNSKKSGTCTIGLVTCS